MPNLNNSSILGQDFWHQLEIIPNVNSGEWTYAPTDEACIYSIESQNTLEPSQASALEKLTSHY